MKDRFVILSTGSWSTNLTSEFADAIATEADSGHLGFLYALL